jgi:signal transduction histidine kinase
MAQLKTAAASHDIELVFDAPETFPTVMPDETKTRQVIMNFMDNAIYYTPKGGHIHINLRELPQSVELEVIDDGIGVPHDERHNLFTKFYRAKNAQRARPDGTGLGLFMAKKVIVAQGGALIFDSKEGAGSKFGFSFPKDAPVKNATVTPVKS